jgi:NAD(P)-dependent dehydrogenase (short-subunit alcohol dehydrogenase family)
MEDSAPSRNLLPVQCSVLPERLCWLHQHVPYRCQRGGASITTVAEVAWQCVDAVAVNVRAPGKSLSNASSSGRGFRKLCTPCTTMLRARRLYAAAMAAVSAMSVEAAHSMDRHGPPYLVRRVQGLCLGATTTALLLLAA